MSASSAHAHNRATCSAPSCERGCSALPARLEGVCIPESRPFTTDVWMVMQMCEEIRLSVSPHMCVLHTSRCGYYIVLRFLFSFVVCRSCRRVGCPAARRAGAEGPVRSRVVSGVT